MGRAKGFVAKPIDTTAGALVWVQRRNGSWWPARVVGPEELPKECVVSEKSGTPVKLLGRDNPTVDWYADKSIRLKAFQCGEFTSCIEKAKKSATSETNKKVYRFARREDAILQALQIQKASLGDDKKDEEMQETHDSLDTQEDAKEFPDEVFAVGKKKKTPNDSEEDGAGRIKRMRGLEDIGEGAIVSFKRKRSPVAIVHEYLKKKSRRRTITKVLERTTVVDMPVLSDQPVRQNGTLVKGIQKKNRTSSSKLGCRGNGSSDHLFAVPPTAPKSRAENDELIESGSASSGGAADTDSPKWRQKGKRKARHSSRSKLQVQGDNPHLRAVEQNVVGLVLRSGRNVDYNSTATPPPQPRTVADIKAENPEEWSSSHRSLPFRKSRFVLNPKYNACDIFLSHHLTKNTLFDVEVVVEGSYRLPHDVSFVPVKFRGGQIVGHPIPVEVVEGYADQLLRSSECNSSSYDMEDDNTHGFDRVYKRMSGGRRAAAARKNGGAQGQKIRSLSTLTNHKKGGGSNGYSYYDKKPVIEDLKGPVIACVPLTVVFSRLNAALRG